MKGTIIIMDAGNTRTKLARARDGHVVDVKAFPSASDTDWMAALNSLTNGDAPEAVVISSVVPNLDPHLAKAAEKAGSRALFVPRDLPLSIKNQYARPHEVGADRLVNAFAARTLFDDQVLVVVDFGTATTFDCVRNNAYLGGLICPGVLSSVQSLFERTAKLPKATLEVDYDRLRVGRSTLDSLNQGLVHGFASMVEGLCTRLGNELGATPKVLATGGFAPTIAKACSAIDIVRPDLILEGLVMAWDKSQKT